MQQTDVRENYPLARDRWLSRDSFVLVHFPLLFFLRARIRLKRTPEKTKFACQKENTRKRTAVDIKIQGGRRRARALNIWTWRDSSEKTLSFFFVSYSHSRKLKIHSFLENMYEKIPICFVRDYVWLGTRVDFSYVFFFFSIPPVPPTDFRVIYHVECCQNLPPCCPVVLTFACIILYVEVIHVFSIDFFAFIDLFPWIGAKIILEKLQHFVHHFGEKKRQ